MTPSFTTIEAANLWASYVSRINSLVRSLPPELAHELTSDLTDHLAQAYMSRDLALPEVARLLAAIERMGTPEEYLREILADHFIEKGTTGIAPISLSRGLTMDIARGGRSAALALLFACGFIAVISFAALAILSPFLPMHVGLLDMPNGTHLLGFSSEPGVHEYLGWWRIPIGVFGALGIWYGLARLRVQARIERLSQGNPGDVKPVGAGVSELRIDHGPGYRVYFMKSGALVIVLLAGGDKSTQDIDIKRAINIAKEWKE